VEATQAAAENHKTLDNSETESGQGGTDMEEVNDPETEEEGEIREEEETMAESSKDDEDNSLQVLGEINEISEALAGLKKSAIQILTDTPDVEAKKLP